MQMLVSLASRRDASDLQTDCGVEILPRWIEVRPAECGVRTRTRRHTAEASGCRNIARDLHPATRTFGLCHSDSGPEPPGPPLRSSELARQPSTPPATSAVRCSDAQGSRVAPPGAAIRSPFQLRYTQVGFIIFALSVIWDFLVDFVYLYLFDFWVILCLDLLFFMYVSIWFITV